MRFSPALALSIFWLFWFFWFFWVFALPVTAQGNIGVAVIIDVFTKFAWAEPIRDKSTRSVAAALIHVLTSFGTFKVLQSDNGKEFASRLVAEVCRLVGVSQIFTSPYNPRANGVVERVNRTLIEVLRKIAHDDTTLWDRKLDVALHAYRSKIHSTTGYSPFYLMFGRDSTLVSEWHPSEIAVTEEADEILHHMKKMALLHNLTYDCARKTMSSEADRRKRIQDKRAGPNVRPEPLEVGSTVYVRRPKHGQTTLEKLKPKYHGPYQVARVNTAGNYVLVDEAGEELTRSLPRNHLKTTPDLEADADSFQWPAEPVLVLQERATDLGHEVRVRWLGDTTRSDPEEWIRSERLATEDPLPYEEE